MKSAIDSAGRTVIPKPLRVRLGLDPGRTVDVRQRDGRIEIELAPAALSLARGIGGRVAVPDEELPPLTHEIVRTNLEGTRRWSPSPLNWDAALR